MAIRLFLAILFAFLATTAHAQTRQFMQNSTTSNVYQNKNNAVTGSIMQQQLLMIEGAVATLSDPNTFSYNQTFLGGMTTPTLNGVLIGNGTSAVTAVPIGSIGGGGAVATLVSGISYTIPGPGWYVVTTANMTLTMPALSAGGPVIVTDASYVSNPNITIAGTINTDAGGASINAPGSGFRFGPDPTNSTWRIQQ